MSSPDNDHERPAASASFALGVGVLAVSTGAIFARFAQQEAASLTVAAYRMGIAFVLVLIPTWIKHRRELRALTGPDAILAATSGFFLAIHFAAWIYSLELTSVAISVVLVNTAPLWVGLLTPLVTGERLARATILGIILSVVGAGAIGLGLPSDANSRNDLFGGLMATVGAFGLAGYLLLGRKLRRRHTVGVYVTVCYGSAAGYLGLAAIGTGQQLAGFSRSTWLSLLGLAVVSQVLGHTTTNWALRYFAASVIAVVLLGEPIVSTLLAFLLFDETITLVQMGGAALILAGIYQSTRAGKR